MSYDLAVWVGERPSDSEAGDLFEEMADRYEELYDERVPPSPVVLDFLRAVVDAWPDDDEVVGFWSVAPVVPDTGAGDIAMLTMTVHEQLDEMVADIVRIARSLELVVYDPQSEQLLS